MDTGEFNEAECRKRLNEEAERLREMLAQETKRIVKLKVAQDTAIWDLKEKLLQVEGNHERLQQNMVEVQMQHEAMSGQYQNELRLRPETLNKMSSTRGICDVLENYTDRLKATVSRCKRDQAALYDAYKQSGRVMRETQLQRAQTDHNRDQLLASAEEKLALTMKHHNQLVHFLTSSKQQLESELGNTRNKLSVALQHKEESTAQIATLRHELDLKQKDLKTAEEAVVSLQRDIKQMMSDFTQQSDEMRKILNKKDRDIQEVIQANEELEKARSYQETYIKDVCAMNNEFKEKISNLEVDYSTELNNRKEKENKLIHANFEIERLEKEIQILSDKKQELENLVIDKDEILKQTCKEVMTIKNQLQSTKSEKEQLSLELTQVNKELTQVDKEAKLKADQIKELKAQVQEYEKKILNLEVEMEELRDASTQQIEFLTSANQQKDRALEYDKNTIANLTADLKTTSEARDQAEATLQQLQRKLEAEKHAARDNECKLRSQLEMLDETIRSKDEELSQQMTAILDIRAEKERLQSKIEGMQVTIDNIQKELTRPALPEADDNARVTQPVKMSTPRATTPKISSLSNEAKQIENLLYSFFSDSSLDGDTLDPLEVNQRFDAITRGEPMNTAPLTALKRRANGPLNGGIGVPKSQGRVKRNTTTDDRKVSSPEANNASNTKENCYFKTKRNRKK